MRHWATDPRPVRRRSRSRTAAIPGPAHPVGGRTAIRLEVFQRPRRAWPEDAIDPAAVEAEAAETGLEISDIVTTKVRRGEEQQAITELPTGLDQRRPGLLVTAPVAAQAPSALEGAHGLFGGTTKRRRLGAGGGWKAGSAEAALQVAYGLAALTGCQREVGRNSLSS